MVEIIIGVLWLAFVVYWVVSAGRSKETKIYQKVVWGGVSARVFIVILLIILWTMPFFSYPLYILNPMLEILGIVICVSGLVFCVWAREALGKNWSANPAETKKGHKLITSGPYSLVRHPIYTGEVLALLGSLIAISELKVLILFAIFTFGVFMRSRIEDDLMLKTFPSEYTEYKGRVKSLIPGIY